MKIKNISVGDFVQVKKRLVSNMFKAKQVCEVIRIDSEHKFRPDVLIKGEYCLEWVNHKDLKKPIKREPEPQLKQLDQSVFDGLDEKWRFAAVDGNGDAVKYTLRVEPHTKVGEFVLGDNSVRNNLVKNFSHQLIGKGYDASNWQNSLIERDIAKELLEVDLSSELTGSELCKAMLARGDKYVSGFGHHHSDRLALESKFADTVSKHTQCFQSSQNAWDYFVPINNQGEPLTASEVGL